MSSESSSTSILLIEDNKVCQKVLSTFLKKTIIGTVNIFTATNSAAAIDLFKANMHLLTIIVCDGNLEEGSTLNGPQLANELIAIQNKNSLNIPIIAWTDDVDLLGNENSLPSDSQNECLTFQRVCFFNNRPFIKLDKPAKLSNVKEVMTQELLLGL